MKVSGDAEASFPNFKAHKRLKDNYWKLLIPSASILSGTGTSNMKSNE